MASASGPKPPTKSGTRRRAARVLIVDDDRPLGSVLARVLGDDHEVVLVDDANEALRRLSAGEVFDVILCDVMMPTMDGVAFYERLTATRPDQAERVVFMSGGGFTARIESFFATTRNLVLEKPFDLDGLRALVCRRLGATEPASPTCRVVGR